jgi:Flp pilus assembly protein TadD
MRLILALLALLLATPAQAQSSTAELDTLFAKLRDPTTGAQVLSIEQQVWAIWMTSGTKEQNDSLAKAAQVMGTGQGKIALAILDDLVRDAPRFAEAWNKRATLHYLMGHYQASLDDIVKTVDLEPRHFGALSGRGMVLMKLGRNAEALAAFKEALQVNPNMVGAKLSIQALEKQCRNCSSASRELHCGAKPINS